MSLNGREELFIIEGNKPGQGIKNEIVYWRARPNYARDLNSLCYTRGIFKAGWPGGNLTANVFYERRGRKMKQDSQ